MKKERIVIALSVLIGVPTVITILPGGTDIESSVIGYFVGLCTAFVAAAFWRMDV